MLRGLKLMMPKFEALGIPFFLLKGNPMETVPELVEKTKAALLVTDFAPLRLGRQWRDEASFMFCGDLHAGNHPQMNLQQSQMIAKRVFTSPGSQLVLLCCIREACCLDGPDAIEREAFLDIWDLDCCSEAASVALSEGGKENRGAIPRGGCPQCGALLGCE
jgi:hypothetical protein